MFMQHTRNHDTQSRVYVPTRSEARSGSVFGRLSSSPTSQRSSLFGDLRRSYQDPRGNICAQPPHCISGVSQRRQANPGYFTGFVDNTDQVYRPEENSFSISRSTLDSSKYTTGQSNAEFSATTEMQNLFNSSTGNVHAAVARQTMLARTRTPAQESQQSGVSTLSRTLPLPRNFNQLSQCAPHPLPPAFMPRHSFAYTDAPHPQSFFMPGTTLPPPPTTPLNPMMLEHSMEPLKKVPFVSMRRHQNPVPTRQANGCGPNDAASTVKVVFPSHPQRLSRPSTVNLAFIATPFEHKLPQKEPVENQEMILANGSEEIQKLRLLSSDSASVRRDVESRPVSKPRDTTSIRACPYSEQADNDRCHLTSSTASGPTTSASRVFDEFESPRSLVVSTDLQKSDMAHDVGRSCTTEMLAADYSMESHSDVLSDGATAKTVISNGSSRQDLERKESAKATGIVRRGYPRQMVSLSEGPDDGVVTPNRLRFLKSSPLTLLLENRGQLSRSLIPTYF